MRFENVEGFSLIGIAARTSFAREKEPGGAIPALWGRVMAGALSSISNRADRNIVALYTDYASDEYGEYTLVIGAKVTSIDGVPEGMTMAHVRAGRFAVFTTERGPVANVVIAAWKRIWDEPRTVQYERSYRNDFEIYGENAADPANTQIEIFIGVK